MATRKPNPPPSDSGAGAIAGLTVVAILFIFMWTHFWNEQGYEEGLRRGASFMLNCAESEKVSAYNCVYNFQQLYLKD